MKEENRKYAREAMDIVEHAAHKIGSRLPGSDGEIKLHKYMGEKLREIGIEPKTEEFAVSPRSGIGGLGYAGWSVNIGIPVVVIATNITIFVFMMVRRRDWRSYIMPQLELTLIAAVELLLVSLEVVTWKLLTLVAVFTVLVQLFGIFVIGGRSTTLELNRRFRV